MGLKTPDQARRALFDQSNSKRFNSKTGKLPDRPYRPDLVPLGPIRHFFGEIGARGELPLKLESSLCGRLGLKTGGQVRQAQFLINRRPNDPTLKLGYYLTDLIVSI